MTLRFLSPSLLINDILLGKIKTLMIINHTCYFCQKKIKEAAIVQVLKFNKQSEHLDIFQLGIQQGHSSFPVTLVNPKCVANALDESLCFLAQSTIVFFQTGKTYFYITGDIWAIWYLLFLSFYKETSSSFRKGEFLFFNLNFNQIYFSEAHVHHHLTGYNKLVIKKQWHQMTLRKKKWLRKNCERETIVIPLCKDVASATEWSLTPQKCPLSGQGST